MIQAPFKFVSSRIAVARTPLTTNVICGKVCTCCMLMHNTVHAYRHLFPGDHDLLSYFHITLGAAMFVSLTIKLVPAFIIMSGAFCISQCQH